MVARGFWVVVSAGFGWIWFGVFIAVLVVRLMLADFC